LENNIGVKLHDPELGNDFSTKSTSDKKRTDKWYYIKIINLYAVNGTKKMTRVTK